MTTNLYDLPKDMLVKMISTIREDTKKEMEEETEEMFKKIRDKIIINIKMQIEVVAIENDLYRDINHNFIIRNGSNDFIVVAVEENGIRRSLSNLEKRVAYILGMNFEN